MVSCWQVDELSVGFVLNETMYVAIAGIVPHSLSFELEGVQMSRLLVVCMGVSTAIATAAYVTADKADPEV